MNTLGLTLGVVIGFLVGGLVAEAVLYRLWGNDEFASDYPWVVAFTVWIGFMILGGWIGATKI